MLKYLDTMVTFSEVPDEVSLCINITNCPYHCPECHSKELWQDIGDRLDIGVLCDLVDANKGISCVCFMGGDSDLDELYHLFRFFPLLFKDLKLAWYTGRENIPNDLPSSIDYIKLGPYKSEFGPLGNPNTNQRLYYKTNDVWLDITHKFWKNDSNS